MSTARECVKKIIDENIAGRKLVEIGKFTVLDNYLEECGVHIDKHIIFETDVTFSSNNVGLAYLANNRENIYLLISYPRIDSTLRGMLKMYGYDKIKDYCHVQNMHSTIKTGVDYFDDFNNRCNYVPENLTIVFKGTNASVNFGSNIVVMPGTILSVYNDSIVNVGSDCKLQGVIDIYDNATLNIGNHCACKFCQVIVAKKGYIGIGDDTTFTNSTYLNIYDEGKIIFGKDCMVASNVVFLCADGHPVYSVNDFARTNIGTTKNVIEIKDLVWIGLRSIILSKTSIGPGSIVGAGSVVKGNFPNNCLIAGNPAKVKKTDIAWGRNFEDEIDEHTKYYFKPTGEQN